MTYNLRDLSQKVHTKPGSPVHIGESFGPQKIFLSQYNKTDYNFMELENLGELLKLDINSTHWLAFVGLENQEKIMEVGEKLGIHPLVIEDILNTSQRPKIEDYGDYIFVVNKNLYYENYELKSSQVSFILFDNLLISFQEFPLEIFETTNLRLKDGPNIRKNGADYLLYNLMDSIVDNYYLVLENMGNKIDLIEDELLTNPHKELLEEIYNLKRDLIHMRNYLWPTRNIITTISRNELELISEKTIYYFRDIYDHTIQVIDLTETSRDICAGMLDTYLSSIGNKTNEAMKVLTVFSTISVPLTFLTGLYGMNFKFFPSLEWKYAYPTFWLIVIIISLLMLKYFKDKDWI